MSQQWNVIGFSAMSCVSTVTDCFIFYLSGVSVSHVGCLDKLFVFVWKRSGIFGTLLLPWLCALVVYFSFTCQFCTFVASQDIVHRWGSNIASKQKQFAQRFPVRDFWFPVSVRVEGGITKWGRCQDISAMFDLQDTCNDGRFLRGFWRGSVFRVRVR